MAFRPRLICRIRVANASDAALAVTSITSELTGKPRFATLTELGHRLLTTTPVSRLIHCDIAFTTEANLNAAYNAIASKFTSGPLQNRILAGSRVYRHFCPDFDEPYDGVNGIDCKNDPLTSFAQTVKV